MNTTWIWPLFTDISGGIAGFLDAPWWVYVLYVVVACHITLLSVTLYLHRSKAHLAVSFVKPLEHFFRFWLWLTTGMSTVEWVAVHRKHHAKVETADDPHSPVIAGINQVLFRGVELYRKETRNPETLKKYAHDIPMDFLERHFYFGRFSRLGIQILVVINVVCFGFIGITIWALQMLCIPLLAAGVINGLGHYVGYRNFETPDNSTNLTPWALIVVGEELHNNHHAYPSSAKFSLRPWEFDFGWFYLVILRALGLVRINRVAPRPHFDYSRENLENDTIRAIIRSRMHVTADYTKRVLMPLIHEAKSHADRTPSLLRALRLLKSEIRSRRPVLQIDLPDVGSMKELRLGMDFCQRLNEIWETTHASQEKLYQAMRDWCQDAEDSGVASLSRFAQTLRGYSLSYQWH